MTAVAVRFVRTASSESEVATMSTVRACFWLEAGLAALCGALALLTAFAHTWIGTVTGLDPEHRNG